MSTGARWASSVALLGNRLPVLHHPDGLANGVYQSTQGSLQLGLVASSSRKSPHKLTIPNVLCVERGSLNPSILALPRFSLRDPSQGGPFGSSEATSASNAGGIGEEPLTLCLYTLRKP